MENEAELGSVDKCRHQSESSSKLDIAKRINPVIQRAGWINKGEPKGLSAHGIRFAALSASFILTTSAGVSVELVKNVAKDA